MSSDPRVRALVEDIERLHTGAVGDGRAPVTPPRRVLAVGVGPGLYGIPIEHIAEISKLTPITFVPGAPACVLGVTGLRGQILPVLSLRRMLGLDAAEGAAGTPREATGAGTPRIVVVRHGELTAGLLVDSASEVYSLTAPLEAPLAAPPREMAIHEGQTMLGDRLLILLRVPALFAAVLEA